MLEMVDKEYIRKKHFVEGWSIRKISRNLKVARQTIRKALNDSHIPHYQLTKEKPSPVLDPYKEIIREWLKQDESAPPKQRHTARKIYDRLKEDHGFTGGESTVRTFVQREKRQHVEMFVPLTADWGEQAQVDWGRAKVYIQGHYTEVCLFCLRLKASLIPFVWASPTEKLEAFLEGHKRAFEWLGGVPSSLVYDNPKTAVTKILKGPHRQEHTVFSSLRAHYLFDSDFCNPASGNEKGTVENLVKFVRRSAMVPVPHVHSLDELNEQLLHWCEKQRRIRSKEWEQERQGLRALPSVPFPCSRTHMVSTSRLLLFQLDRNTYSVPVAYGNRHLRVEAFVDRIEVYDASKLVTVHERSYSRGEKVMKLEHYLPLIQTKPRSAKNALVVRKLPEVYQKLRVRMCSNDPEGYREFAKILLLHLEYRFEDVLAAVEEGLLHHSPSQESIRQILMVHASTPKVSLRETKSPLARLEVPVDTPSKYDHLMGGANHDGVA
ncbi:IS21 family transposase [Desulfitobacterium chlororespirans]|uniref:Transposase n=3 Tax=Desulfitobacterium chlororespirans DSM 11544 TaxID=1121395 RepID=A0A1M7V083_9FIRM|nr:IS21 family transposase [Desulfitobacterium chlororespirans]SHN88607.1 Transposase [Desulfitobacterium chlororespirans DSM 11544]